MHYKPAPALCYSKKYTFKYLFFFHRYLLSQTSGLWYHYPAISAVFGGYVCGILFQIIYYFKFHPNNYVKCQCERPQDECVCKIKPIRTWIKFSELLSKRRHTGNPGVQPNLQKNVPFTQQPSAGERVLINSKAQRSGAIESRDSMSNIGAHTQNVPSVLSGPALPSCERSPIQNPAAQRSPNHRSQAQITQNQGSPRGAQQSPNHRSPAQGSPVQRSPMNPNGSPLNHHTCAVTCTPPDHGTPCRPGPTPSPHRDVYITPPSTRSPAPGDISLLSSSSDTSHVEQNVPLIKNSKQTTV